MHETVSSFIMNAFFRRQNVALQIMKYKKNTTLHERRRKNNKTAIEFLMRKKYFFLQGILILKRVCM